MSKKEPRPDKTGRSCFLMIRFVHRSLNSYLSDSLSPTVKNTVTGYPIDPGQLWGM
jgi:hypothetical protein